MKFDPENITPDAGPYKVLLKRGEFADETREGRIVPYKIYFPDFSAFPAKAGILSGNEEDPRFRGEGNSFKVPVIIWSHGFGGNRDGASFISRFIASHGYCIVHITHHGTDSSLWEGKPGHPWDILQKTKVPRAASINRMLDVSFALEELHAWADENPSIGAHMDFDCLGMSGHSFGALTTQVMAGQMIPNEEEALSSYHEPRFKAGILYSPVPIRHLVADDVLDVDIYGSISMPLLHMTGTQDDSPIEGFDYTHRLVVHEHSGHDEKHLLVLKDGDHMVYNGTRGKLGASANRARHEEIIKIASLAYWDAQLKNNAEAENWFSDGSFQKFLGDDGKYTT